MDPNIRPGRDLPHKGIYITSSGMMVERTPSYNVAASLLSHEQNGFCFVGYCDPSTPGGQLLDQKDKDSFFFEALDHLAPIRASIDQFDLSGHAERTELLNYAINSQADTIVLTHGDPDARNWFNEKLGHQLPNCTVIDPRPLSEYRIG